MELLHIWDISGSTYCCDLELLEDKGPLLAKVFVEASEVFGINNMILLGFGADCSEFQHTRKSFNGSIRTFQWNLHTCPSWRGSTFG